MPKDIIIVGAGAAGIAAARTLRDLGGKPMVVEARGRVGGRAWTDTATFGFPVDLGCAWLHSANLNPWMTYAREHGFNVIDRSPVWQRRIGREEASPEYLAAWRAAYERNEKLIGEAAHSGLDVPVAQIMPQDRFRPLFDAVMGWLMGVDSDQMSTVDYDRYEDSDCNWAVVEGLGSVVAHAARDLDVRLDTPVRTIDWGAGRIRVGTARGELEADAVIVTVPTTVLAGDDSIRFTPVLPQAHLEAFHDVPLGVANKVFFQMEPGALPYEGSINFVGTDQSAATGSYQTRPAGHEVLMAFFGGGLARELEQRNELEGFARDELARIFGSKFSSQVRRTVHTQWASDPWSRGAYTAALPGKAHMRRQLSEPVGGRVFFAGEACSLDCFGTIHGARQSGVDAAMRAFATQQRL